MASSWTHRRGSPSAVIEYLALEPRSITETSRSAEVDHLAM